MKNGYYETRIEQIKADKKRLMKELPVMTRRQSQKIMKVLLKIVRIELGASSEIEQRIISKSIHDVLEDKL